MSYEAYPPPLSSSPPPLDALPSPTDEEDEQEFELRTGVGSPVFDITGLSEKLPPTPQGSPVKSVRSLSPDHLPEAVSSPVQVGKEALSPIPSGAASSVVLSDDDDFGDFAVGTSSDILEIKMDLNNEPSVDVFSENIENLRYREEGPNNCDFGEFTNFQTSIPAANIQSRSVGDDKHLSLNESNVSCIVIPVDNSAPEPCDYAVINSTKDFLNVDATCENLSSPTCSVDSSESICIDREKPSIPSPVLVKNEHGHMVPEEPFVIDKENDVFHYFESPTTIPFGLPENSEALNIESDHKSLPDKKFAENNGEISYEINNPKFSSENECAHLELHTSKSNQSINIDAPGINAVDVDFGAGVNNSSSLNCQPNHVIKSTAEQDSQLKPCVESIDVSSDDFEAFADFQSFPSAEEPFKAVFDCSSSAGVDVPAVGALVNEVVMSCSLPTIEGRTDNSPDDDFGYRNIDVEDDSHDHNDQDFPAIEAKNDHIINQVDPEIVEEDDDDFDEFVVSAGVPDDPNPEEFDEFASAKIADAFGEFASESASKALDREAKLTSEEDDDDDDFGEFTDFGVADSSADVPVVDVQGSSVPPLSRSISLDSRPDLDTVKDPLLSKLDGLVRKWITIPTDSSDSSSQPDVLRDVVKGDAFVWRKLESVEWESVMWQSTVAHGLLLTALNMDARNILYSQKWSSSVPLFAQSLSFSPLTPAKPTSGSALNSHAQNNSSSDTCQLPAQLPSNGGGALTVQPEIETTSTNSSHSRVLSKETDIDVSSLDSLHPSSNRAASSCSHLDWLSYEGGSDQDSSQPSGGSSARSTGASERSMPAAVQRLLASSTTTAAHVTSLDQLTDRERQFLKSLPDLSFMTAKVLMFPIAGEKD
ncbi:Aftiphilin clathrin-binding box [Trinorchestia longiramus]|nr:Aftiphilin clathrin-binding box [Trinorchestia longiramus]